jgi:acetylglutamate kinase
MNRRILIKIGGRAFEDAESLGGLALAIKSFPDIDFILVHGGGAEISEALKKAQRVTKFIDGVRVTGPKDLDIVENVLSETVNKRITNVFEKNGVSTTRLSGKSEQLLVTRPFKKSGNDYGLVGEVKTVNPNIVLKTIAQKSVPIVSPISANEDGVGYNVNADSAAAALAVGSFCTDLVYFTDVPGVQVDEKYREFMTENQAKVLIASGTIYGGMVAKMESIFNVLESGVERVYITKWQNEKEFANLINGKPALCTKITK